jgi:arylsulfatase A-like enzyme
MQNAMTIQQVNIKKYTCVLSIALLCLCNAHAEKAPVISKPNIIVILADDLGWGSLGCYGAPISLIKTPNIDRLANEGARFTNAHSAASVCTPSRYGMMTGRYCWRSSLKSGNVADDGKLLIETERPTMASILKGNGYNTAMIGKWHLGFGSKTPADFTEPLRPGPVDLGFNYFYGLPSNHGDPAGIYIDTAEDEKGERFNKVEGLRSNVVAPFGQTVYKKPFWGIDAPQRVDEDVMPLLTQKAIDWMQLQKNEVPFFLYFTPVAVHVPITPSKDTSGTSPAGVYGDWIHELDLSIGKILDYLDKNGLAGNTMIIFTADNGGDRYGMGAEAIKSGLNINGHWKGGKHSIYEGGLRAPYLVRWPNKVPAQHVSDDPICLVDTLATVAAAAGAPLPHLSQGAEDSFNLLPVFLNQKQQTPIRSILVGHSTSGVYSITQGSWKWIEGIPANPKANKSDRRSEETNAQLYNLEQDPAETKDLIAEHPDIAQKLAIILKQYRDQGYSRETKQAE